MSTLPTITPTRSACLRHRRFRADQRDQVRRQTMRQNGKSVPLQRIPSQATHYAGLGAAAAGATGILLPLEGGGLGSGSAALQRQHRPVSHLMAGQGWRSQPAREAGPGAAHSPAWAPTIRATGSPSTTLRPAMGSPRTSILPDAARRPTRSFMFA